MSIEMKALIVVVIVVGLVVFAIVYWLLPKRLKRNKFGDKWSDLQAQLKDKASWADAILAADKMLDEALKKRKFKGGSMGERMVSAQRFFTNNDDLWFAHNLCKKIKADHEMKLKEVDVKDALLGFRQALRDIGALENGKSREA
jgi:hypothetical protein